MCPRYTIRVPCSQRHLGPVRHGQRALADSWVGTKEDDHDQAAAQGVAHCGLPGRRPPLPAPTLRRRRSRPCRKLAPRASMERLMARGWR